jgi:uncharacterized YigZ family protein
MSERTRTIAANGSHEIVIRKSRFICSLARITSEEEGKAFIGQMRKQYWDASHNCSAWVIGPRGELQRSNDDGEPSGTAGQPMLSALNHRQLTDVVAVVTRYFGGTLLGAGGLVRAYGQAVTDAINSAGIVERKPMTILLVESPHDLAGKLDFALRGSSFHVADIAWAEKVGFELHLSEEEVDPFREWLAESTGGQLAAETIGVEFVEVPVENNNS